MLRQSEYEYTTSILVPPIAPPKKSMALQADVLGRFVQKVSLAQTIIGWFFVRRIVATKSAE